ncbi:MAG: hypothetical protein IJL44_04245 [Bacteroidales bacterium]|nr:hypothetical protein [Bacteroidales bacterium]
MNNTFNINRFGKLLALDGRKYFRNFGITLIILSSLTVVLWLLTLVFGFTMPSIARWALGYVAVMLALILVPAKAFGDINLSREGVRFAMLPTSSQEKYLSYVLFCLLTPFVCLLLYWCIDTLLTLLPFGGYRHFVRGLGIKNVMGNFVTEIGELTNEDVYGENYESLQEFMSIFNPRYNWSMIIGLIFNAGLFMFGNLLFKTHKTAKTLVILIGVSYILTMVMQMLLLPKAIYYWQEGNTAGMSLNPDGLKNFTTTSSTIGNIFHTILAIGLYIGLFFKLKTQKY